MPLHTEYPYYINRMKEANRLMAFAMRRDPDEYYDTIERPGLLELHEEAGNFTAAEYSHEFNDESGAVDLFKAGIQDVIPAFSAIAEHNPELPQEEARALMMNEETIATYGLLASFSQQMVGLINSRALTHFALSADRQAIMFAQPTHSSSRFGCEAVKAQGGTVEMTHLFKKFVSWSGSLAVLAYFEDH